jgi:hypothetical protein
MIISGFQQHSYMLAKFEKSLRSPCTLLTFYPVIPEEVSNRILL